MAPGHPATAEVRLDFLFDIPKPNEISPPSLDHTRPKLKKPSLFAKKQQKHLQLVKWWSPSCPNAHTAERDFFF